MLTAINCTIPGINKFIRNSDLNECIDQNSARDTFLNFLSIKYNFLIIDVKTTTNYCISLFINQHWVQFSFPYVTAENFLPALNFFQMLATTRPNPVRQTAQAKPCNAKTRASKYLRQFFCCLMLSVENFEIQLALTIFSFWLSILVLTTLSPLLWIVKCFGCYGLKRRIITLGGKTTVQLIFSFIELIYTKQDNMLLFE